MAIQYDPIGTDECSQSSNYHHPLDARHQPPCSETGSNDTICEPTDSNNQITWRDNKTAEAGNQCTLRDCRNVIVRPITKPSCCGQRKFSTKTCGTAVGLIMWPLQSIYRIVQCRMSAIKQCGKSLDTLMDWARLAPSTISQGSVHVSNAHIERTGQDKIRPLSVIVKHWRVVYRTLVDECIYWVAWSKPSNLW